MFLFKSHKTLSHKQQAIVGFVLALMSILSTAVIVYGFPLFAAWLNSKGIFHLDLLLLATVFTIFVSVQALLLFGFPLFYAKDKKSHMTGFQILLYALMWIVLLVFLIALLTVGLVSGGGASVPVNSLDQLTP